MTLVDVPRDADGFSYGRYRHVGLPVWHGWRFGIVWLGQPDYFFVGFFQVCDA